MATEQWRKVKHTHAVVTKPLHGQNFGRGMHKRRAEFKGERTSDSGHKKVRWILWLQTTKKLDCCCSITQSCPTLHDPVHCRMPGFPVLTISQSLLKFMSIESVIPSNHFILCCPLLLLPSIFPSIRSFSMSWLLASGGQRIGASASASLFLMNIQG